MDESENKCRVCGSESIKAKDSDLLLASKSRVLESSERIEACCESCGVKYELRRSSTKQLLKG